MFILNEDKSIYITRGDIAFFSVQINVEGTDELYRFQPGEVVRFKVFDKKGCDCVAMQKDFPIVQETDTVEIFLGEADTKIGGVISKPKDYWYEVELNPHTNPQTVIAYDEEGPRVFKLFPEGKDVDVSEGYTPEVIPTIDTQLDATSLRPIANQPVALAIMRIESSIAEANILNRAAYDIALTIQEKAERGEFDGEDGHTPEKGVDYFTDEDIAGVVQDVVDDLDRETWTFFKEDGSVVRKSVMTAEVTSPTHTEKWKFAMENQTVVNKRVVIAND